jgi:PhnB protein
MHLQPYLSFEGRCEEAIEFYKAAIGAKVNVLLRFKESPEPPPSGQFPPQVLEKVMHASLSVGLSNFMASDGRCTGQPNFEGIALTLTVADDAEAKRVFAALTSGGKVTMPLTKTFFSSQFGMCSDKFGVGWMILVGH